MWAIIATWRMALEGVSASSELLKNGQSAGDAVENAIKMIEDFPYYKSVGYGGLPNEDMIVELDAGYMDGDTFGVGAIMAIKDFKNPISIARSLSQEGVNCVLVSEGAESYARKKGFESQNMLSDRAVIHYKNRLKQQNQELKPYIGHDTVGMVCLDCDQKIVVGTSTSGLFMKKRGRVGDSPIIGSGFYADSQIGGASATGLGEDLMKGVVSYEIVKLMEKGYSPQQACEEVVFSLEKKLKAKRGKVGDLSVVAINNKGQFGAASNVEGFSFVYASSKQSPTVYLVKRKGDNCLFEVASKQWLDDYLKTRMAPLKEI